MPEYCCDEVLTTKYCKSGTLITRTNTLQYESDPTMLWTSTITEPDHTRTHITGAKRFFRIGPNNQVQKIYLCHRCHLHSKNPWYGGSALFKTRKEALAHNVTTHIELSIAADTQ